MDTNRTPLIGLLGDPIPGEPIFPLLARDPRSPALVDLLAGLLEAEGGSAAKVVMLRAAAEDMRLWRTTREASEDLTLPPSETVQDIFDAVCHASGCSLAEIVGEGRQARVSHPRQLIMLLIRQRLGFSLPRIAKVLNKADHTTISSGIRSAKNRLKDDIGFAGLNHAVLETLDGGPKQAAAQEKEVSNRNLGKAAEPNDDTRPATKTAIAKPVQTRKPEAALPENPRSLPARQAPAARSKSIRKLLPDGTRSGQSPLKHGAAGDVTDLTGLESRVLRAVIRHSGAKSGRLAEVVGVHRSVCGGALKRLVSKEYLGRTQGAVFMVLRTPSGKPVPSASPESDSAAVHDVISKNGVTKCPPVVVYPEQRYGKPREGFL